MDFSCDEDRSWQLARQVRPREALGKGSETASVMGFYLEEEGTFDCLGDGGVSRYNWIDKFLVNGPKFFHFHVVGCLGSTL